MSINLVEKIQQDLGYPPLQKIDPNTQKMVEDATMPNEHKFSQAAIPAVLTALYKYVQTDEGANEFLQGDRTTNWVSKIFLDNTKEALQTISTYASQSKEDPVAKINEIANKAVQVAKENLPANPVAKDVKNLFSNESKNILLYLPAALQMGDLLHDNTLDDNTNKMEGPISSLMHSIGSAFSKPDTDEDVKKQ